jgi:hypothetical protein
MAKATIRVATKKNKDYNPKKKASKISKIIPMMEGGKPKMGMTLKGKKVVPNLAAMKKRKIITSMD